MLRARKDGEAELMPDDGDQAQGAKSVPSVPCTWHRGDPALSRDRLVPCPSITTDRPTSHALALLHLHSRHCHHELDDNDDDDIDSRADTGQPMCRSHRHPPELPRRESAVYHHYHHHHLLHRHHRMQVTASRSHPPIPSTNCRKNCSFG